ncbi:hypothetical protein AVEN_230669-1 [Araneus ventricosus]|uniref:Uncharacterized protein n=1 Tax=Araneus ventricosus TaxID=182803 RepID=A0A4Y2A1W6_ARAVE|nr:hypothetical protein AVEN_230669-1 [Araneus ventricosus]
MSVPNSVALGLAICSVERQYTHSALLLGRAGLVVRSRLRGRRAPGSKPDFTEDLSCIGPNALRLVWCGSLERGCQLRCSLRHLTEVPPKMALVLLQNGALI